MTFYLCVSGYGRYLAPRDGHERCIACLGLAHAEAAFVDESWTHCWKMTISELRSRLQFLQRCRVPVPLPRSDPPQRVAMNGGTGDQRITVSALPSGNQPPRNPHSSSSRAAGGARWAISKVCTIRVLWCSSRWPDVDSCIGGLVRLFWRWHVGAVACFGDGSCVEMMPMLSRAANRVGLVWNPPSCPETSRLDDWFLGVARAGSQPPTLVPFFPEVHEELTGMWKAPFNAWNVSVGPSPSPPLMAVWLWVTSASPHVERAVAMQLCLNSTWRGERLSLPGPASTRRILLAGLTRPVGKPCPPYTLWRCCRSTRPRHSGICTRVAMIRKFFRNFVPRRTSRYGRWRLRRGRWVVWSPLWWSRNAISHCVWPNWGIPTKSGSLIPPCPRPASSVRGRELRPGVWGDQSHPARAVQCCIHSAAGSTSACSSPKATPGAASAPAPQ